MRIRFVITIIACCLIASCKNSTQTTPDDFTSSTSWIYSDNNFDSTDKVVSSQTDTVTIISSNISNSQKTLNFSDSSNIVLSANGSTWILLQFNPSSALCVFSAFPGIAGDTISKTTNIPLKINGKVSQGTIVTFIKDVNVSVTVPAGNFSCTIYEMDIFVNGIIEAKILTYVSGSVGVVQKDYYLLNAKTGALYLSERRQLK
jgi:hypothetical protein